MSAYDHPNMPILFPKTKQAKTYHVGSCILTEEPIISHQNGLTRSIYFKQCTGAYINMLGEQIVVRKIKSKRAKIGDMNGVPVVRTAMPAEVPEKDPFEVRYAMAVLKAWGKDTEELKFVVKARVLCKFGQCSKGGRGIKAGAL